MLELSSWIVWASADGAAAGSGSWFTLANVIVWLIVGGITGAVVGAVLAGKKQGFGFFKNLAIGLAGALIGGGIFSVFKIDLGLGAVSVSLEQVVASVLGAFIFALTVWMMRKSKAKKAA